MHEHWPSVAWGEVNEPVRKRAICDSLTGVFNRRRLADLIAAEDAQPLDTCKIDAVLMIGINRFKSIDDTFGHLIGDTVIKSVAHVISEEAGSQAFVGCFGGEEFVCLTQARQVQSEFRARDFAEIIRTRISNVDFADIPALKRVTVSIGYAQCSLFGGTRAALARADAARLRPKKPGATCVREALSASMPTAQAH